MLDATETLILIAIFALAALLIVVPRALARRTRERGAEGGGAPGGGS
jgi:hypothetical protein